MESLRNKFFKSLGPVHTSKGLFDLFSSTHIRFPRSLDRARLELLAAVAFCEVDLESQGNLTIYRKNDPIKRGNNFLTKKLLKRRITPVNKAEINRIFGIILAFFSFFLSFPNRASAERPFLITETAIPVEKGNYRLEGGLVLNRLSSNTRDSVLEIDLRYGLIQNLEVDLVVPYLFREEDGEHKNQIGDVLLRAKVRFIKGREANPLSIAGQLILKLPTAGSDQFFGTSGEPDLGFVAIASKEFTPVTAHINFGYIFIGNTPFGDEPDQIRYALGLELQTNEEPVLLIGEVSGSTEIGNSASKGIITLLGGIKYKITPIASIDGSIGFGLTHDSPDYLLNVGFTYLFP